ncbi:hypothetical protein V5799_002907 [Amblyomma americanum]|uniref:Uncharacterized protein n=1 Tax=Amblyomma americanum TaxID=6943 RepID=A0AAQ4DAH5_AMBAM
MGSRCRPLLRTSEQASRSPALPIPDHGNNTQCQDVRLHLQRPQRGSGWRFGRRHTDDIGRPLSWEPSAVAAGGSSRCADHPSQHPWSHRRLLSDVIEKKVALPVWSCTARE